MKLTQKLALSLLRTELALLGFFSKKAAAKKAVRLFCTPQKRIRKELPSVFKHAEHLRFALQDIPVQGYRWNHPSPRKVLLLHGLDSTVTNFEHYVQPLLQKGFEVLAFDAPAHGASGGDIITVPLYREMILAINERYGPIQSFVAHSMGGLALAMSLDRLKPAADTRLVLIAPATESSTAADNFLTFLRITDKKVRRIFEQLIISMTGYPLSWFSIPRTLEYNTNRVLWIHDDADAVTPLGDTTALREKNYPWLKFVTTHGLGHRRIYRDKKVVTTVIDFL